MTVKSLATELGLWDDIYQQITNCAGSKAVRLLARLADLPVKRSHATRRLGSYVSQRGRPLCIRLQFAQEAESLKQTLLHEIAHFCTQQSSSLWRRDRRSHGPQWQAWAKALGSSTSSCGKSEALNRLHQERLKLVATCQKCGAEFHRARRLNRGRNYFHSQCGGPLQPI